jgi:predicted Zn-dependent peptidase
VVFRQYRDIFERIENVREDIRKTIFMREQLIETFNQSLGGLRLSMRLRKRSGGLLAWRNIATRSSKQRDYDLLHYRDDLGRLPQTVRNQLLQFDKQRILLNLNWSMLQHESKQLNQAAKKIEANTTVIEPMLS